MSIEFGLSLGGERPSWKRSRHAIPVAAALILASAVPVWAGSCVNAGPPYEIGAQAGPILLDTDCTGPGGTVNVVGDVTSTAVTSGVILDSLGGAQNWDVVVAPGVTISGLGNSMIHIRDSGGSVDNSGAITGGSTTINFVNVPGSVINRAGATIIQTSGSTSAIEMGAGGTLDNRGDIGMLNDGAYAVALFGAGSIMNSGTIRGQLFGIVMGGSVAGTVLNNSGTIVASSSGEAIGVQNGATIINSGSILGGTGQNGIRSLTGAMDVTNSGTISGDTAIVYNQGASTQDRLEIQPGSVITGIVNAGPGTDILAFGGTGTHSFDISSVDGNNTGNGEQYLNFETFLKEDASTFTLTGDNSEIAAFSVTGGLLNISGNMGSTAFTLNGGALGGSGMIGGVTVNGGTISPGNSIGTVTVNGALNLGAGSTYEVEVDAAGNNDLIDVTGTVTLGGGTLSVLAAGGGTYGPSTNYIIIANDGADAVTGTFGTIMTDLAFLTPTLNYAAGTGNDVALTLTQSATFASVAVTYNQSQSATGLASLDQTAGTDAATVYSAILGLTAEQARTAFDAAQGEVHADALAAAARAGDGFLDILMQMADRGGQTAAPSTAELSLAPLTTAPSNTAEGALSAYSGTASGTADVSGDLSPHWFAGGFGSFDSVFGDGNASGWQAVTGGFAAGLEANLGEVLDAPISGGFGVGYSRTGGGPTARNQSFTVDSFYTGIFGHAGAEGFEEGLSVHGALDYAHQSFSSSRGIVVGTLSRTATASYLGSAANGAIEASYTFLLHEADQAVLAVSPFFRLEGGHVWTQGFTETGAGALNLTAAPGGHTPVSVALGVSISGEIELDDATVSPTVYFAYERAIGDVMPSASLGLAGSPTGFSVLGPGQARDRANLGGTLDVAFASGLTVKLGASGALSASGTSFAASAGLEGMF